jgi:hypothetical protein
VSTSALVEKRRTRRDLVTDLDEIVEIELPYPAGTTLIRSLVDKTKTGFAFRMSPGEGEFLPNTPLRIKCLGKASEPRAFLGRICHATLTLTAPVRTLSDRAEKEEGI